MRVLIVADNTLAAEAIRREMRHASGFNIAGFVNARGFCPDTVRGEDPDVVLMDDMRSRDAALALIPAVRAAMPAAKLVLLTLDTDPAWLASAGAQGIDAAIAKTVRPGSLGTLVREVVKGHVFHAFASVAPAPRAARQTSLTARELEILRLAAAGSSNASIARGLWVTEQTVKFHLSNVYRKLGVVNRTQASHFAHKHGLLDPTPEPAVLPARQPVRAAA